MRCIRRSVGGRSHRRPPHNALRSSLVGVSHMCRYAALVDDGYRSLTAVEWPSAGSSTWPPVGRIWCPPTSGLLSSRKEACDFRARLFSQLPQSADFKSEGELSGSMSTGLSQPRLLVCIEQDSIVNASEPRPRMVHGARYFELVPDDVAVNALRYCRARVSDAALHERKAPAETAGVDRCE